MRLLSFNLAKVIIPAAKDPLQNQIGEDCSALHRHPRHHLSGQCPLSEMRFGHGKSHEPEHEIVLPAPDSPNLNLMVIELVEELPHSYLCARCVLRVESLV